MNDIICKNCGGGVVGDGYTTPIRCEFAEYDPSEYEPDCEPIQCKGVKL